jgi:hypothetical protein
MRIVTGVDDGSWRTILVTDANPDQQTALEELGFPPDLVQRYPPGTRYFDRAVANLRQVVDRMVRQNAPQAPADWSQAFRDLLPRADQARIPLVVVGSVALAIRGVDVRPGDIDVLTTEEGADALAESYQDALVVPLATIEGFGRFGRAFTGMRVEWLGNPARAQEGPWPLAAAAWSVASPFEGVWWESPPSTNTAGLRPRTARRVHRGELAGRASVIEAQDVMGRNHSDRADLSKMRCPLSPAAGRESSRWRPVTCWPVGMRRSARAAGDREAGHHTSSWSRAW